MKPPEKLTKKERIDWTVLMDTMTMVECDLLQPVVQFGRIPVDWTVIAKEGVSPAKTRITARFDADVVKFFRTLGPGYQAKMNRVLKSWMLMRVVGLVEGQESEEIVEKILRYRDMERARPKVGDMRAFLDRVGE
jgi:hypothetical protein